MQDTVIIMSFILMSAAKRSLTEAKENTEGFLEELSFHLVINELITQRQEKGEDGEKGCSWKKGYNAQEQDR